MQTHSTNKLTSQGASTANASFLQIGYPKEQQTKTMVPIFGCGSAFIGELNVFLLIFGLAQKREDLSENTLGIFLTLLITWLCFRCL